MATKWISRLDAFPRTEEHLTQKTSTGAVVSVIGISMMALLFLNELQYFLKTYTVHEMSVDMTKNKTLPIHINITFPALPCQVLSLDALDMSGKHEVDLDVGIYKIRLNKHGEYIDVEHLDDLKHNPHPDHQKGDNDTAVMAHEYHHEANTGDHIQSIQDAMAAHEGCMVYGRLDVERVAGNFHVSVHGQSYYVLQRVFTDVKQVNISHIIHKASFGPEYPGIVNPLDGFVRILEDHKSTESGTFKYFLKVVPTTYRHLNGEVIPTNQFSVTEYFTPSRPHDNTLPAVYFLYDLSPVAVTVEEKRRNFFHFITRLCAVLGGTFAVSGLLDRWIHRLIKHLEKTGALRGLIS
eukprot:TRINITY_DN3696_c0_g3_i1.p1 TRINITY_DN3696_c0_g3~~TRINITY_DN3696_c0_g3_i1.p1  ORF type:complete len:351 (+),score=56.23 TRINITY_DN3696_c0_g3_i1:119-1171(+)